MILENVINHIRDREYMGGVERDIARIRSTGEVFTPTELCIEIIDKLEEQDPSLFSDPDKTFLDPSCGDGQILGEIIIRKMERGVPFENALASVFGIEFQESNVAICRDRLLCGQEHLRAIVKTNIVCHNTLEYDFSFNGSDLTDFQIEQAKLIKPTKKAKKNKNSVDDESTDNSDDKTNTTSDIDISTKKTNTSKPVDNPLFVFK